MKRFILLALATCLLVLGVALPAFGSSLWGQCGASSVASATVGSADRRITGYELECFHFNADEDSGIFVVFAPSALICLDPDKTTDGAATAQVMIRKCAWGGTTYSANTCLPILDASLDGTGGAKDTQNACERVGPGTYAIVNTTSAATDEAVVSVQAEQ